MLRKEGRENILDHVNKKNRKKDLGKRFTVINAQVRKDSACARKCYAGC